MNDKIKELAVQAMHKHFPSFDNITARGQYSSSTYNRAIEEMMLMFAESIVRECADAAEEAVSHAIFNTTMHDNDIPNYVRAKVENIWKQNERQD